MAAGGGVAAADGAARIPFGRVIRLHDGLEPSLATPTARASLLDTGRAVREAPTDSTIAGPGGVVWSVADLLRHDYKQSEYGKVILPLVGCGASTACWSPPRRPCSTSTSTDPDG